MLLMNQRSSPTPYTTRLLVPDYSTLNGVSKHLAKSYLQRHLLIQVHVIVALGISLLQQFNPLTPLENLGLYQATASRMNQRWVQD